MPVELIAIVGEREIRLTVDAGRPRWTVAVDGQRLELDARELRPGTWSILVDGRSFVVDVDRSSGRSEVTVDGRELPITLEDARARELRAALRREGAAVRSGEVVRAPIAGKVVKVVVAVGDAVGVGDSVLVLEAMKMENELRASRGGTVVAVEVGAGDPVETNQALIRLE